uniref:Uncharacterized protein n=1 Tax=Haemonchus contortus TaxID=6289 RepID=A0A7I5EDK1_HAECO
MTDVAVVPSFNTGSDHRLVRGRFYLDCGLVRLTRIRSRQPCPTILDEDAVTRLAKEESFEVMDDIDADYENLVQTVTAIASSCRYCSQPQFSPHLCFFSCATREAKKYGSTGKSCGVHFAK